MDHFHSIPLLPKHKQVEGLLLSGNAPCFRGQAEFPANVVSAFNPVKNLQDKRKGSCDKTWIAHQKVGICNFKTTKTNKDHARRTTHPLIDRYFEILTFEPCCMWCSHQNRRCSQVFISTMVTCGTRSQCKFGTPVTWRGEKWSKTNQ